MTKRKHPLACALAALVPLATVVSLSGCAAGSVTPAPEIVRGVEGTERVVQRGQEVAFAVEAPVTAVFAAVEAVYEELELKVVDRVPREGLVAGEDRRLVRLAGRRASDYVDCGSTFSGPVADNAQVQLVATSVVTPSGGGSALVVRVDAQAQPRGGVEGVRECTSTGRLEALLLERVRARTGSNP